MTTRQVCGKTRRSRWFIGALLGSGILVNFFDRSALSVVSKPIADTYGLSLGDLGIIFSAFTWSYCLLQLPAGLLLDKIGVKWPNRVGSTLWTVGCVLSASATGPMMMALSRVVLGIGEAPAMCAAAKATSIWFPVAERSLATALFDGATKLSNVIALPVLALTAQLWGWRAAFALTAGLSAGYVVAWWRSYRDPLAPPGRFTVAETNGDTKRTSDTSKLVSLLHDRKVWALIVGFACYGYVINVLLAWVPGYLEIQLHMSVLRSGLYVAIPWAVATVADVVIGGWLVDRLVRTAHDPGRIRKIFLLSGMGLGAAVGMTAMSGTPGWAVFWMAVSIGGLSVAAPIAWSLPGLIVAPDSVGTVSGMMNFLNTFVTSVGVILTGFLAEATRSFAEPFLVAAGVLVIGLGFYGPVLGRPQNPREQTKTCEDPLHCRDDRI